jgi:hypothetical protein
MIINDHVFLALSPFWKWVALALGYRRGQPVRVRRQR